MSRPYDSNEANALLTQVSSTMDLVDGVNIETYKNAYSALAPRTRKFLTKGTVDYYLEDPRGNAYSTLEGSYNNLRSAIDQFSAIDENGNGRIIGTYETYENTSPTAALGIDLSEITVHCDGRDMIMLSQSGFSNEASNSPLKTEFFLCTNGKIGSGSGTSISGAACSMCSCINGIIDIKGFNYVMDKTGAHEYYTTYYNQSGSVNAAALASLNKAFTTDWYAACSDEPYENISPAARIMRDNYVTSQDRKNYAARAAKTAKHTTAQGVSLDSDELFSFSNNKEKAMQVFVGSYFRDDVTLVTSDFQSMSGLKRGSQIMDKAQGTISQYLASQGVSGVDVTQAMSDRGMGMIFRYPENKFNKNARVPSGSGHYAYTGYDSDHPDYFCSYDSAVRVDKRNAELVKNKNRLGYIPINNYYSEKYLKLNGAIYILDNDYFGINPSETREGVSGESGPVRRT